MAPFRVVVHHPDEEHKDHAPAALGPLFDDLEDVNEFLANAASADLEELQSTNASLAPIVRVRKRDYEHLAEANLLGYETEIEELHVKAVDEDGQPTEHEWSAA